MRLMYLKPKLNDLSQGSRIAFTRQIRMLSQDDVSDMLNLKGESKRRTMTRYEKGERSPKKNRINELSKILLINQNIIKEYDFKNNNEIIYFLLWLEELYPKMNIELNTDNIEVNEFMTEWEEIKSKKNKRIITYEEYIEWKLQCKLK